MGKNTRKIHSFLGSKKLFWVVFFIFIFEASWIALSAAYPQAFDENYHFGLIQIYSHNWLPFFSHQPVGANSFGAVAHDPSFMYHYVMSYPYRLINYFIHNTDAQIIILRFFDIGLFAWALVLFRKILLKIGLSDQMGNLILFLLVLIPVVPQLAGQINYDDLLIPLVALSTLVSLKVIDQINHKKLKAKTFLWLALICLFSSLVKIEFGPIFLGIILFLGYLIHKNYKHHYRKFGLELLSDWKKQSLIFKIVIIVAFVFLGSMFIERDGYNMYKYHAIDPNCSQILTTGQCSSYSVWSAVDSRHHYVVSNKVSVMNPISYTGSWLYWMWYRLFFAVNGPNNFTNYPPLPLPIAASLIIFIFGFYSLIRNWRKVFEKNYYLKFLGTISVLYLGILMYEGYSIYLYTNTLELMNGRYLLPILVFLAAIIGSSFRYSLRSSVVKRTIFGVLILIMFLEGGGLLTFIVRSDNSWYWNNSTVLKINDDAKKITSKIVIPGSKTYTSNDWFFD